MELFLYGDPRLLAGGGGVNNSSRGSYESAPPTVSGKGLRTVDLERVRTCAEDTPFDLAARCGQQIHRGKSGYHATPVYNNFLVKGQWPSAGIELETIMSVTTADNARRACDDLRSNWFHFERDGSLDHAHSGEYGYELITEPLPPRVYRDPRTWIGLENAISPWLESFDHSETGLHVHVGLNQFMDFDAIPIKNRISRMYVGKMMSALVYYVLAGSALVDRVTLRKNTNYCATTSSESLFEGFAEIESGRMTGAQFVDLAVAKLSKEMIDSWASATRTATSYVMNATNPPAYCQGVLCGTTSHGTEVNCEHKFTIEFRRGKGTCHALSIHRMVELMTGIVRYAGKCCREPEMEVSRRSFLDFIARTTTSEVLRHMIERKGN